MLPCRLYIDPPADGAWNMAVDEALLAAAIDGTASLRFYQWREPTLSLGYFQSCEQRLSHPPSSNAAVVRRTSGGGALMHDRELTYALCLPASHPQSRQAASLYGAVHSALIAVLAHAGVAALQHGQQLAGRGVPAAQPSDESFLCFDRRTEADVVLPDLHAPTQAAKIAGSAQRRRQGAVLQHGSALLAASRCAPELLGIAELSAASLSADQVVTSWSAGIADRLGLQLIPADGYDATLKADAMRLLEKFQSPAWTSRR